jgi:hypothetical protein
MILIQEIGIEVLMIAAVVGSIACLVYLLQVTVRERAYLRRAERERREARKAIGRWKWTDPRIEQDPPATSCTKADTPSALRHKRA